MASAFYLITFVHFLEFTERIDLNDIRFLTGYHRDLISVTVYPERNIGHGKHLPVRTLIGLLYIMSKPVSGIRIPERDAYEAEAKKLMKKIESLKDEIGR